MPKKILVIEDETYLRDLVIDMLEMEGLKPLSAADGMTGLKLAQEHQPDLILCDVMMPGLDGYQVLTKLRQNPATTAIPFIFLSACATKSDLRQGMQLGADDYLTKPFTAEELIGAITTRLIKQESMTQQYTKALEQAELELQNLRMQMQVLQLEHQPEASARMLELEAGLAPALERSEFLLHYQPQVNLQTGQVVGAEALLRWQHPELGLVPPAEFIPIAEASGLIDQIGQWVLETACLQLQDWQRQGLGLSRIAVNLSSRQFKSPHLTENILSIIEKSGLDPDSLELELTESLLVEDTAGVALALGEFRALNIGVAIDDFGTGYSSLSYLQRFAFNTLKIDRSFVRNLPNHPKNQVILSAVIQMAHRLELRVIAEGVETEAEMMLLQQYECDEVQGYFFSRPLPATEFERYMAARQPGSSYRVKVESKS